MKRERVTDFGELIKLFWKPSKENTYYEENEKEDIILGDIDAKIFKEAFNNIEKLEVLLEKNPKEEHKNKRVFGTQKNVEKGQVEKNINEISKYKDGKERQGREYDE